MKTNYALVIDNGESHKVTENGTYYNSDTPDEIINVLEKAKYRGTRLFLSLGDTETGRDWNEVHGVTGTVGRSTGPIKIPIILHNKRSTGGPAILTHCIVRIATSRGKNVLYQHDNYHK